MRLKFAQDTQLLVPALHPQVRILPLSQHLSINGALIEVKTLLHLIDPFSYFPEMIMVV